MKLIFIFEYEKEEKDGDEEKENEEEEFNIYGWYAHPMFKNGIIYIFYISIIYN